MIKLLVPVNYKGEMYEPGIVHFESEYENKLVESGNATFDIAETNQVDDKSASDQSDTLSKTQNDEKSDEKQETVKKAKTSRKTAAEK